MDLPRILIVGTIPFNPSTQSRAMGSYFGCWEKDKRAAQIFSNPNKPVHGHCSTFYQITDSMMLSAMLHRKKCEGIIYSDSQLDDQVPGCNKSGQQLTSKIFNIAKRNKSYLVRLLRKILWNKKRWLTESLTNWINDFNPDIIYLAFSNDFFINEIALYIAKLKKIPIVTVIGDDYVFNRKFSISPFYFIYAKKYRKLVRSIFSYNTGVLYTSEKIREKYTKFFNNQNDVIYISSDFKCAPTLNLGDQPKRIIYAGNLALGRHKPLYDVMRCVEKMDNVELDVYASLVPKSFLKKAKKFSHTTLFNPIPYNSLMSKISESNSILIVESFTKRDIKTTEFSLSTKVADGLMSGIPIIAYGPQQSGCIYYLEQNLNGCVCTNKNCLNEHINKCVFNIEYRETISNQEQKLALTNHTKEKNSLIFYNFVKKMVK